MCFYSRHVSMYQVCHRRGVRAQDRKDPYNMAAWRRCRHCVPFFKIQGRPRLCRSYPLCKYFMYVAKTCANLTKYSRKPENYNGTIIFEIDIMKYSSPINLNLCQTWLFLNYFGCFFCFDLLWSWAEIAVSPAEKKCYFGFDMAKNVNFKLSGDEFFMTSISKIFAIVIPRFSTTCGSVRNDFGGIHETFTYDAPEYSQNSSN